jgi:hypothetical protein
MKRKPRKTPLQLARAELKRLRKSFDPIIVTAVTVKEFVPPKMIVYGMDPGPPQEVDAPMGFCRFLKPVL